MDEIIDMKIVNILKLGAGGQNIFDNFEQLYAEALDELKNEVDRRIKNIINTPKFSRRGNPLNYRLIKNIKNRDGNICKQCGKSGENIRLEVAHILPVELFPEYAFEDWNARIECHKCNHRGGTMSIRQSEKKNHELYYAINNISNPR